MIQLIKKEELKTLYQNHLEMDFPEEERVDTTLSLLLKNIEEGKVEAFYYIEEDKKKGYFLKRQVQDMILIQFFAIFKAYRGNGIGSRFLQEIKEKYKDQKALLLEVENPMAAKNEKEKQIREKRNHFYEKNGFEIEQLIYELYDVSCYIMSFSFKGKLEKNQIIKTMKDFYPEAEKKNKIIIKEK